MQANLVRIIDMTNMHNAVFLLDDIREYKQLCGLAKPVWDWMERMFVFVIN